jgi:tyrosyl-tRNA synthetase
MAKMLSVDEKFELVKRNTSEIISESELRDLLKKKKKPSVYLGTAITKSPHVAYFTVAIKLADFLKAGFKVKVLLADLHGALDGTPWDVLEKRYKYYEKVFPLMFKSIGVDTKNLEFVKGSKFELTKEYQEDLFKLSTIVSVRDSMKAASEVVKQGENPRISGLIYPLMQALDEEYLEVDIQYGGMDQRKIFVLAGEILPKINYKKRIHVMTPILRGLIGEKMSSSDEKGKIDLLDSEESVRKKIRNAECIAGNPKNGLMDFLRYVVFVIKKDNGENLIIKRKKEYGGDLKYENYTDLENDFVLNKLHPLDLKNTVADEINNLLDPFRKNKKEINKLFKAAY